LWRDLLQDNNLPNLLLKNLHPPLIMIFIYQRFISNADAAIARGEKVVVTNFLVPGFLHIFLVA
jgi:hypothetical protein